MDPILLKLLETGDASAIIDYIDREDDAAREEEEILNDTWLHEYSFSRIG